VNTSKGEFNICISIEKDTVICKTNSASGKSNTVFGICHYIYICFAKLCITFKTSFNWE
jgi:hypothetical protein